MLAIIKPTIVMVKLIFKELTKLFFKVVFITTLFFSFSLCSQTDRLSLNLGVKLYVPYASSYYVTQNKSFLSYLAVTPIIGGEVRLHKNINLEFRSNYFIIPYSRNFPANANLSFSQKITDNGLYVNSYFTTKRNYLVKLSVGITRNRFISVLDVKTWKSSLAVGTKFKWMYFEFRYEPNLDYFLEKNLFSLNLFYRIPIKKNETIN